MTTSQRHASSIVMLIAVLTTALVGCGSSGVPTYRAGGKVVFADGKPLEGGRVEFRSVGGPQPVVARGEIQPDGSFRLSTYRSNDGAIEGDYVALVSPPMPELKTGQPIPRVVPLIIDSRYSQFDTSGLKFTVTRDPTKNQFTIQVDRPGK